MRIRILRDWKPAQPEPVSAASRPVETALPVEILYLRNPRKAPPINIKTDPPPPKRRGFTRDQIAVDARISRRFW